MLKRTALGAGLLGLAGYGLYQWRYQVASRLLRLPPPQHAVDVEYSLAVPMPDSVTLYADHFYPQHAADAPTILIRTPYGRPAELGVWGWSLNLTCSLFAAQGYHVVIQGTRGRFQSGGVFDPFVNEAADGHATLDWVAQQPWFNGALGLWGPSYLGYVQWAVAADAPPFLRAMVPMITSSRFSRLFYPQGAFSLESSLRWAYLATTMEGDHKRFDWGAARKLMPARREAALLPALDHLPLDDADRVATGQSVGFYQNWIQQTDVDSDYWHRVDHANAASSVAVPVHLVAGWYDIFLNGQLADYAALVAAGHTPYLTVGPQSHLDQSMTWEGIRQGLAWFAVHLKGDHEQLRRRAVRIFVMGADEWHEMDFWPPPAALTRYYLRADAMLATDAPTADAPPDHYRYDPHDPTPGVGGTVLSDQGGPQDQRTVESRADVLVYTTPPLAHDVDVIGPVRAELYVQSSLERTDFVARLCDVSPTGQSTNVADGLFRVEINNGERQPDGSLRVEIDMWSTAQRFKTGHRIRLQVASAAHPRWSRNLGTGEPLATATGGDVAEQTVYHDVNHRSALVLPIVDPEDRGAKIFGQQA